MVAVVDDHHDIAQALVILIKSRGIPAVAFDSCKGFLDAIEKTAPSVVVLDVMMPGIDGIECLRTLRSTPQWRNIPVIMFSADHRSERIAEAKRLGANDFVVKSKVDWGALVARIEQFAVAS